MAKGKLKSGGRPMYDDDPGCKYVVVENPWPYCGSAASRNESYFRHVGAWLWYASNKTLLPDELFYVSTKNEVVVKYAQHLDITALLGKHDWRQFSLKDNPAENGYSTYIFEFNYGTKGHPDEHQWASQAFEDFSQDAKLQRGALPVRQPYPRPVWADCRDRLRSCRDLALPMPTDIPKPVLPPSEPVSAQPEFTSIYSGLAGRIPERPEQPAALTREGPSDGSNRSGQLYTGKLESEDEGE
ncbi:hypothetical protein BC835DRAFT_303856 [Cytidiella melzeri]|nr:hypothetical protein BC835DRAFT_303856 [Cytidiella melzeri]